MIITNPEYWECECDYGNLWVHPKTEDYCEICDSYADESPDARPEDVEHFYPEGR